MKPEHKKHFKPKIIKSALELKRIPKFKGYWTKSISFPSGKVNKVWVTPEEQKRGHILNLIASALFVTYETPYRIWFENIKELRKGFRDNLVVTKALNVIENNLKKVTNKKKQ